jgi:hypothetical protein
MTALTTEREMRLMREQVEILCGSRGNAEKEAMRKGDGQVLREYIAKGLSDLEKQQAELRKIIEGRYDVTATLSRAIVWVPADETGEVSSYDDAFTDVVLRTATGEDVSAFFTLETATGGNPQDLTVDYTDQHAQVSAGLDAGEDQAQVDILAVGTDIYAGREFHLTFTLRKNVTDGPGGGSSNDRNDLIPDQPGVMSTPENVRLSATGNVTVACSFSIVFSSDPTNKNSYDFLELGVWEAETNAAHTMGTDDREVWTLQSTQLATGTYDLLFLLDRAPTSFYTLGVRTVRQVDPDVSPDGSGYIRSPVRQVGPYQPYTQAEIGGITVDDIANAVANFDADNDGNGGDERHGVGRQLFGRIGQDQRGMELHPFDDCWRGKQYRRVSGRADAARLIGRLPLQPSG